MKHQDLIARIIECALNDNNDPNTPNGVGRKLKNLTLSPFHESTKSLAEKTIEDVLLHFGETVRVARRRYRDFVEKGMDQGRRLEFQGGGLVRSAGGKKVGLLGRKKGEREKGDERILGSGDFVGEILQQAEATFERKYLPKRPIQELVEIVAGELAVRPQVICSGNRKKQYTDARSLLAWIAVEEVGHPAPASLCLAGGLACEAGGEARN